MIDWQDYGGAARVSVLENHAFPTEVLLKPPTNQWWLMHMSVPGMYQNPPVQATDLTYSTGAARAPSVVEMIRAAPAMTAEDAIARRYVMVAPVSRVGLVN